MTPSADIRLPQGPDAEAWLRRWDRMQERYLPRREERLAVAWHFEQLRRAGSVGRDCCWRWEGDAVYGAVRPSGAAPGPEGLGLADSPWNEP